MFTYITTTTVPSFPEIQEQYGITPDQLNWTVAIPALGLALGPLLWSSFADIVGRRIIFILGTIIALAATIGAALAPNYGGYMAARFFQGLGVSPAATVGLSIINDLFFEHERGQKIGWWVLAIDLGLYVGPLIGKTNYFLVLLSQSLTIIKVVLWIWSVTFGSNGSQQSFSAPSSLPKSSSSQKPCIRASFCCEPLVQNLSPILPLDQSLQCPKRHSTTHPLP